MAKQDLMFLGTPAATASVTTSSGATAFPQQGEVIIITNTGSNPAFCNVGTSAVTASATLNICVPAGTQTSFKVAYQNTYLGHISTGGATTLNFAVGNGI